MNAWKRRPRLPLRHQQANRNINNFYLKEMEANLIENNSSDLSHSPCEQRRTEKFRRRHKTLQASLYVRRDVGGGRKFKENMESWYQKTNEDEGKKDGKTNKKLST